MKTTIELNKHMRNPMLYFYAASLMACTGASLNATAAETSVLTEAPARPPYRPWTVGAEAGSTGVGGFGSWRFLDHLGVRLGGDYLGYSQSGTKLTDLHYDTRLRLLSEPLTLDVYPWQKHSFHVSLGAMFNQNELTGTASDSRTITIDGRTFAIDRGSLNVKITQQPVNPYLSIGGNFFYLDHAHHWAVGGELGVAYTGDPKVSLTRSGGFGVIDAAVHHEQNRLQNYADQFKWLPVAKLNVSYSF